MNVLFVDLGNVGLSPMAESLLKKKLENYHIEGKVDSAGFESFNINEPPEEHAASVAGKYGYKLEGRARIFIKNDFELFDRIFVMDTTSYIKVMELTKTDVHKEKVDYLLNLLNGDKNNSIPDPLNRGTNDWDAIFQMIDASTDKIIEQLKK